MLNRAVTATKGLLAGTYTKDGRRVDCQLKTKLPNKEWLTAELTRSRFRGPNEHKYSLVVYRRSDYGDFFIPTVTATSWEVIRQRHRLVDVLRVIAAAAAERAKSQADTAAAAALEDVGKAAGRPVPPPYTPRSDAEKVLWPPSS